METGCNASVEKKAKKSENAHQNMVQQEKETQDIQKN